MRIINRNGESEEVRLDAITERIKKACEYCNIDTTDYPVRVAVKVVNSVRDNITTSELDDITARICMNWSLEHPNWGTLGSRIIVSNHQKNTSWSFSDAINFLYNNKDYHNNKCPLVSKEIYETVNSCPELYNSLVVKERDFLLDYFGFKTLERSYLLKTSDKVIRETPQYLFLRVALGIWNTNTEKVKETYNMLSQKYATHATPTLFNSGTPLPQLSSCFDENTLVDTFTGPKKIKDVCIGDKVVTHLGNIKEVKQIHKNEVGTRKMYELNVYKTEPLIVTGNHEFWCFNKKDNGVCWKSVEDMNEHDCISIPNTEEYEVSDINCWNELSNFEQKFTTGYRRPEIEGDTISIKTQWSHKNLNNGQEITCSKMSTKINNIIKVNEEFCKFIGIWLGDGHIITGKNIHGDSIIRGIGITISKNNHKLIDFCKNTGKFLFGLNHITTHEMKNQNTFQIIFNNPVLGILFNKLFGKGFDGKDIPSFIFNYPKKLILELISGLVSSDGCISSTGTITLTMSNEYLIRKIYTLCRLHGFDVSSVRKSIPKKSKNLSYTIGLTCLKNEISGIYKCYNDSRIDNIKNKTKIKNQFSPIETNNTKFIPIKKIKQINYNKKYVYTLGIEDDHSYSVGGLIAKNCFLLGTEDSVEGIYKTITDCARISKWSGGIGFHISNIRCKDSYIRGTGGKTDGIIPMLKVYNNTARYIDQSGKRNGSFAAYIEPWHGDIMAFLKAMRNHGSEESLARDLFYALWVPDLFMESVKNDDDWYLMCPDECPGLNECYGEDFRNLYKGYIENNNYKHKVKAREVWDEIIKSQVESGMPYMLYKDSVNKRNNQKNLGVIKSSNLCVAPETMILTSSGYKIIKTLKDQKVKVWNGEKWSETTVRQTGFNQKLIKIKFSNGTELDCTPYHRFCTDQGTILEAKDLTIGQKLLEHKLPTPLEENLPDFPSGMIIVPSAIWSLKSRIKWFSVLADRQGEIDGDTLRIKDTRRDFLVGMVLMFQEMGIHSRVTTENFFEVSASSVTKLGFSPKKLQVLSTQTSLDYSVTVKAIIDEDRKDDTYCFTEPERGMGMFGGVLTMNCAEIMEYSNDKEYAVCNLASLCLPQFVKYNKPGDQKVEVYTKENCRWCDLLKVFFKQTQPQLDVSWISGVEGFSTYPRTFINGKELGGFEKTTEFFRPTIDYTKLEETVSALVENLDTVIDKNYYPTKETKFSNLSHRPMGIGVQGLSDLFAKMWIPYESKEAGVINKEIFESIYYFAVKKSIQLAEEKGPYSSFEGSPLSKGLFQFDHWGTINTTRDFEPLRERMIKHGIRNSLLIALMPTASTSQIMGNNESFEPFNSCMFVRRTLSGEFIVINHRLMNTLHDLGLWDEEMKQRIMFHRGSIQKISQIPQYIRDMYKTVWEIKKKHLINMASERSPFICQSQSFNHYFEDVSPDMLTKTHFYAWKQGLKTGSYYIRTRPATNAQTFTIDPLLEEKFKNENIPDTKECETCSA